MRVNVNLSPETNERLEIIARKFGMTKSSFISFCIGEKINQLDQQTKIMNAVQTTLQDLLKTHFSETNKEGLHNLSHSNQTIYQQ